MFAKIIFVLCAVQSTLGQCTSRAAVADRGIIGTGCSRGPGYCIDGAYGFGLGYGIADAYGLGYGYAAPALEIAPTSGGGLPVTSASAFAPVGLAVESENIYEGILAAAGELPFVGTVGVEGVLPTAGVGAVHHHCGDGINAMVSDKVGAYGIGLDAPLGFEAPLGLAAPGLGYRAGWAGRSCGCGLY